MRITIYKGTKEIGGSYVELRGDKMRQGEDLIDFGLPL